MISQLVVLISGAVGQSGSDPIAYSTNPILSGKKKLSYGWQNIGKKKKNSLVVKESYCAYLRFNWKGFNYCISQKEYKAQ